MIVPLSELPPVVLLAPLALDPQAECVSVGNLLRAYLGRYEAAMKDNPDGKYDLDYPPARLLIMSVWVWRRAG